MTEEECRFTTNYIKTLNDKQFKELVEMLLISDEVWDMLINDAHNTYEFLLKTRELQLKIQEEKYEVRTIRQKTIS